jgi:class 3 adenylate cyclase
MVESVSNRKLMMTIRILRIIRLIRIVKLYKAVIHFITNIENKAMISKLAKKKFEREKLYKKKEEEKKRKETLKSKRASKSVKNRKTRGIYGLNSELIEINKLTEKFATSELINLSPEKYQAALDKSRLKEIEDSIELSAKSNISKAASERITQKVIMVILLMLFLAPLTDDDVYSSSINSSYLMVCRYMNNIFSIKGEFGEEFKTSFELYLNSSVDNYYPIIQILYNTTVIWSNNSFSENITFRTDEKSIAYLPEGLAHIEYSTQALTKLSATINLCRTFFVIFTLSYMAVVLERDLKENVLTPLETMIDLVDSVAKDPVNYKNIESLKVKIKNSMNKKKGPMKRDSTKKNPSENSQPNAIGDIKGAEYEIKVIELAIIKISALLAIGFGEAGGEILRENISSQEGLNPMIAGKKKAAIFGFCDIRHFPDINVALQEKTMVFVNEIADIVHSCVDKFSGSTNKNIGDAFLIIWKFPHLEKILENEESNVDPMAILKNADPIFTSLIADQAVLGYLNIIKNINKSPTVIAYKKNPEIKAKFGDSFKVQMGFGLHVGWGIEGPIGSFYKIDCSYLSPNVNISARLEAATRQYGVTILISGELYDLLSDELKNICRLIDIVTVKGSKFPLRLYTIFVNENLKPDKLKKDMSMKEKRKYYANKKEKLKQELVSKNGTKFVLQKKGFKELLTDKRRPVLFYEKFREGFNNYISGNWEKAYKLFKDAIFLDPNDGPTKTLMNFIKKNNKKAPENWKGFRELTSK